MSEDDIVFPLVECPSGHEIVPIFTFDADAGLTLMACPEHQLILSNDSIIDLLTAEQVTERGYVILV